MLALHTVEPAEAHTYPPLRRKLSRTILTWMPSRESVHSEIQQMSESSLLSFRDRCQLFAPFRCSQNTNVRCSARDSFSKRLCKRFPVNRHIGKMLAKISLDIAPPRRESTALFRSSSSRKSVTRLRTRSKGYRCCSARVSQPREKHVSQAPSRGEVSKSGHEFFAAL